MLGLALSDASRRRRVDAACHDVYDDAAGQRARLRPGTAGRLHAMARPGLRTPKAAGALPRESTCVAGIASGSVRLGRVRCALATAAAGGCAGATERRRCQDAYPCGRRVLPARDRAGWRTAGV